MFCIFLDFLFGDIFIFIFIYICIYTRTRVGLLYSYTCRSQPRAVNGNVKKVDGPTTCTSESPVLPCLSVSTLIARTFVPTAHGARNAVVIIAVVLSRSLHT